MPASRATASVGATASGEGKREIAEVEGMKRDAVLHPIVYVRGYAMSRGEIDETTADPFCGFNVGSTVFRATASRTGPPRKYVFASPVVRLTSDPNLGYSDVFTSGHDIMDDEWEGTLPRKSIVIYRYYDSASTLLGSGVTPSIAEFGRGLSRLIARIRDLVCRDPGNKVTPEQFRCYLVAHSMGGLVCRSFLQNVDLDEAGTRKCVDKFFTYATPHNGIEVGGTNVPAWLAADDIRNFSREYMAEYLKLGDVFEKTKRVDVIRESDGSLSPERMFCLIGTDRSDYEAAAGLSRAFVGHGSDGLVRIENASLCGITSAGVEATPVAKAFVYRSHSGLFGIVNSEESYQNLTRFLFGDIRVDIWVDVEEIRLPEDVQKEADKGRAIDALYQFEILASPRGKLWYLTRRIAEEDSVACLTHGEWMKGGQKPQSLYVSSVFLDNDARVDPNRRSLAYSLTLGVRVPDYEVERRIWLNEHYEGGYLFRDSVVIEIFPPADAGGPWTVMSDWQSGNPGKATKPLEATPTADGKLAFSLAFDNGTKPGMRGRVRFVAAEWNSWNR
jgi:hypothetical protein